MNKMRSCGITVLMLTAAFVLTSVLAPAAQAALRCVPAPIAGQTCDFDYATIQDALAAAGAGDTVMVDAGTYSENVSIGVSLTLTAAPGTKPIIDGTSSGNAVSFWGVNSVTVNGFEIKNGWNGIQGETSLSTFTNNDIHHNVNLPGFNGVGISLWGDNDGNDISNNTIHHNDRQGVFIGFSDPTVRSTENIISGNTIYSNGLDLTTVLPDASQYGIQLWNADENTISGNEIFDHSSWSFGQGVYLCGAENNQVTGNSIHGNRLNIGVFHCGSTSGGNTITDNIIYAATGSGGWAPAGIWNYDDSGAGTNVAHNNCIVGNSNHGVQNLDDVQVLNAENNWWGSADGPAPPGNGDAISGNVDADPFLTVPAIPCKGFVTGGGIVDSYEGADLANTTAAGPATFGFVSKYVKGATAPSGNLEFQFQAGDLNFKSTSMDWLVVTGEPRAQFRGEGTINGATVCKFEADAWDGSYGTGNDAFGLKIFACTGGADRYNLSATALTKGSIVVHKK